MQKSGKTGFIIGEYLVKLSQKKNRYRYR